MEWLIFRDYFFYHLYLGHFAAKSLVQLPQGSWHRSYENTLGKQNVFAIMSRQILLGFTVVWFKKIWPKSLHFMTVCTSEVIPFY